jgi:hypothetical protein
MSCLRTQSSTILHALAAMLLFAATAASQISGLCNTGQTRATTPGCTGVLVSPNPFGGGPQLDGNWELAYPYPIKSTGTGAATPCGLKIFIPAAVDIPLSNPPWLANSASSASEWITPEDGENPIGSGMFVYRTRFPVAAKLPNGNAPTGLTISGQLASDNATFGIYLESPANSGRCSLVSGQTFPVNPSGGSFDDFQQWWPFTFSNPAPISPGDDAYLYFVVQNAYDSVDDGASATGLRVEFFASSAFN